MRPRWLVLLLCLTLIGGASPISAAQDPESASFVVVLREPSSGDPASATAGTAHIQGAVTGPNGTGLAGITVTAHRYNGVIYVVEGSTSTLAGGSYDIPGLVDATEYKVGFNDPQGQFIPQYYNNQPDLYHATPFSLGEGQVKTGIDAQLAPAGRITGILTSGVDGSLVANFGAYAWRLDGGLWSIISYTSSGTDGVYLIGGLPTGTYRVQFRDTLQPPTGTPRYGEEWHFNVPTRSQANDIPVVAGQTYSGINATLNGSGTIAGSIKGPDGTTGAKDIQVDLYQRNPVYNTWDWANGMLSADGNYSIVTLAGTYRASFSDATATPYFVPECYDNKPCYVADELDLELADDITLTADATIMANASLELLALPALPPDFAVTLTPGATDAVLAWPPITEDEAGKPVTMLRYEVWHSAAPYFAIGDANPATRVDVDCTDPAANCAEPAFTEAGALLLPGGRFYLVRGLTDRGGYSPASNKTAKFTFALTPGSP